MLSTKEKQQLITNLNEVSFYFFFILSLVHIISGLLYVNEFYIHITWLINRLLDIPFLIVSLLYLYTIIQNSYIKQGVSTSALDLILIPLFSFIALTAFIADLIFSNQLPF